MDKNKNKDPGTVENKTKQRILEAAKNLSEHAREEQIDQVREYFSSLGLRTPDTTIVLSPDEVAQFEAESKSILPTFHEGHASAAMYRADVDITFVLDLDKNPDHNSVDSTTYLLAHEMAHGTSEWLEKNKRDNDTQKQMARIGLLTQRVGSEYDGKTMHGVILEEGFAEYMAAQFIKEGLHLPNGQWDEGMAFNCPFGDQIITVPGPYAWATPDKDITFASSSATAVGFEMIAQQIPEFHDALIESRHSVDGLRDVAKILNSLSPTLYSQLTKLSYNREDHAHAYNLITAALEPTHDDTAHHE